MNGPAPALKTKGSLEIVEEAVHLLRKTSLGAFALYYMGTLPFVLGMLYFWADMSRSPVAHEHLAGGSLGLAVSFAWMKFWHSIFGCRLSEALAGNRGPRLSLKRSARIFSTQAVLQATGLFLLPMALVLVVPFAWVFSFYQNLTVLDSGVAPSVTDIIRRATKCARMWPSQNPVLLGVLFGFAVLVLLNWGTVCFVLPGLIKMLLGVESVFTRSNFSQLNTTFLAVAIALTYLSVDPILKAVYAVRCFYVESLKTGQDLTAELKLLRGLPQEAALVVVLLLSWVTAPTLFADEHPAVQDRRVQTSSSFSSPQLDQAIDNVAQQRKYTWRAPKPAEIDSQPEGFFQRWLARIGKFCRKTLKGMGEWLDKWLRRLFSRHRAPSQSDSGYGWILAEELLLYGLVLGAVIGLGVLVYRTWRGRRSPVLPISTVPLQPAPDLTDNNVVADQLPEDGWTKLGRELLARGELRLALRAFYFASLVHLAERNLIQLAKFKSNHDYERELRRRGHAFPQVLAPFSANVLVFDRVWYGLHGVSPDLVESFTANLERMKSSAS